MLISIAVLVHLMAVIAAPMATPNFSGGQLVLPNGLQQGIADFVRPYLVMAYLNHGYRFFCPAPSPGHIVRYTLDMPDGSTTTDVFPNLKTEWPRLLYHRFFMLVGKAESLLDPEEPGANTIRRKSIACWAAEPRNLFRRGSGHTLRSCAKPPAQRKVTIELVEATICRARTIWSATGRSTDKALYKMLWTNTYEAERSHEPRHQLFSRFAPRHAGRLEPVLVYTVRSGHARADPDFGRRDVVLHALDLVARSARVSSAAGLADPRNDEQAAAAFAAGVELVLLDSFAGAVVGRPHRLPVVFSLLTIGLWSRTMSVLAFIATVSYINRASLAQFGLDDTNCHAGLVFDGWPVRRGLFGRSLAQAPQSRRAIARCAAALAPTLPSACCKFICA